MELRLPLRCATLAAAISCASGARSMGIERMHEGVRAQDPVSYSTGQSFFYLNSLRKFLAYGFSETLCAYDENCARADGPFDSHWELKYKAVTEALQTIPARFASGDIRKANDLGEFILNDGLWQDDPHLRAIALGAPVVEHAWIRPILDKIMGQNSPAWDAEKVRAHVQRFLAGRTSLDTSKDPYILSTTMLHEFFLGLKLSDEEVKAFVAWQAQLPVFIVLPRFLAWLTGSGHDLRKTRDGLLDKYKLALKAAYENNAPELPLRTLLDEQHRTLDEKNLHLLAHGILDALAFAGGLSVPGAMKVGLAVLHSKSSPLAADQRGLTGEDDVEKFVWELLRRFPPVVAFSFWDPTFSKRTVLALGMALRDPAVWGADAMDFKLRELSDYKKFGKVTWALESNGPDGTLGPNSRGCPGASLSFAMLQEFFQEWHKTQGQWSIAKDNVVFKDYSPWTTDHELQRAA